MSEPIKIVGLDTNMDEGKELDRDVLRRKAQFDNWTSIRTPATSVGQALEEKVKGFPRLEKGIHVLKTTSRGALKHRIITVSRDKFALFVTHNPLKEQGVFSGMARKLGLPMISRKGIRGFISDEALRDQYVRYIDVSDIDDILVGVVGTQKLELTRTRNRLKGYNSQVDIHGEQIVSIIHHGNQSLDLLIPDKKDRQELINGVLATCRAYHEAKKNVSNEALLLRYIWYDVDTDRNGVISPKEFALICARINLYVPRAKEVFQEQTKKTKKQHMNYVETVTFLQQLKRDRQCCVADQLWNKLFDRSSDTVSATDFLTRFMHQEQGQTHITLNDVKEIFLVLNDMELNHTFADHKLSKPDQELSRARFEIYLFDLMNSAYDPFSLEMDGEVALTQPISEYWISTSHNTYLTGDQLQSASSVEMYMKALRRGCKCLELDCWDGEVTSDGRHLPVVFHGHTLTSKILFEDIIRGVRSYIISHPYTYPIILSLENHCSHPYQRAMAETMTGILGDLLYIPSPFDTTGDLPPPERMRGKVVIKGKRPPDSEDAGPGDTVDEELTEEDNQYEDQENPVSPGATTGSAGKNSTEKLPKILPELAKLTLFHGTKYKDFDQSITEPLSHMHSIVESKINKILGKKPLNTDLWREYNVGHMTRTYPSGARVDSSNYSPVLAWYVGCQLVALNFQTSDAPLILNDGMFRQNQGCGYIHKPPAVLARAADDDDDARARALEPPKYEKDALDNVMESFEQIVCGADGTTMDYPAINHHRSSLPVIKHRSVLVGEGKNQALKFKIRVWAGSCLPKPGGSKLGEYIDPYVALTLHDVKRDSTGKATPVVTSHKTSTVNDNGFCPVWPESDGFKNFEIFSPDVAILHLSLLEADIGIDDKIGDASIPVSCLRTGYRSVQLFDKNFSRSGAFGFATLLVEIQVY